MTLGRTSDNKIKIKTDGGLRAVECACCNPGPCGGCPTILGALPATGTPPVKPTSMAWQAVLSIAPNIKCPPFHANLSGVIEGGCEAVVGDAQRCFDPCEDYEDWMGEMYQCYGEKLRADIKIGKFKKVTSLGMAAEPCLTAIPFEALEYDEEADCAYWLILWGARIEGAFGWSSSSTGITGPIPPDQIIGSHSVSCTVYSGRYEPSGEEDAFQCVNFQAIAHSASVTFS
jgi:hypothetical protein